MKRTRKLQFVHQDAERCAALGMTAIEIADHLGLNRSTVGRWFKKGKLKKPDVALSEKEQAPARQSPADWARSMREGCVLDATDEQLVSLGESALSLSRDVTVSAQVQLSAGAQFRAIAKQLAISVRLAAAAQPVPQPKAVNEQPARRLSLARKPVTDPRKGLMAIK